MLAVFSAISFGVAAGAMIGAFVTGDWLYTITWSVAIAVASLTAVLAGIRSYTRGLRSGASGRPLQAGELALARVESIRRTGFSVSDQPQCELVLTVAPRHRAAYTTVHRQIVDIVALAQLQPGSIIVVRRPDASAANVQLELAPPEDWARERDAERLRTGTERTVPLASQTTAWASEPPRLAASPTVPRRPWRRPVLVAVTITAAAIVLVPAYDSIGRTARAWASGDPASAGVALGDRHEEIVDALEEETGGTQFVRIAFYDDYAIAAAPSAPGALTIDTYQFRYDRTERQGPELIQPQEPAAALFDTDQVDFSMVPDLIAAAEEQTGVTDPDSVIVIVERVTVADASGDRPVRMMVLLDSTYEDATVVFDAASGDVLP